MDACQIDLLDAAASLPTQGVFQQIDPVDLDLARRGVAVFQRNGDRLSRPDHGGRWQFHGFAQERRDGLPCIGKAVLDQPVLSNGLGDTSLTVFDLSQQIDGGPFVDAVRRAARRGIDRTAGHDLSQQLASWFWLPGDKMPVAGEVPEAVEQRTVRIARGVLLTGCRGLLEASEFQQITGGCERDLIGRRIVGMVDQQRLEQPSRADQQFGAADSSSLQLGIPIGLGRFGGQLLS